MEDTDRKQQPIKVTKNKFLDILLPVSGCASYELFSVNIMNTSTFTKLLPGWKHPVAAEVLWFNAHIGFGVYLYRQEFFQFAPTSSKIIYSAFLTAMFNFGSVLLWGTTKALLPKSGHWTKAVFGLSSGLAFLYTGWHFIGYLNSHITCTERSNIGNNNEQ